METIEAYRRAVNLGTNYPWVYSNLGSLLMNVELYDEALEVLKKGLALDRSLPLAAYNIGTILCVYMDQPSEALPFLEQAIATDPEFPLAYQNAGTCCLMLEDYSRMRGYYAQFLRLDPDNPNAMEIRSFLDSLE